MLVRREGVFYARVRHGGHKVVADSLGFVVHWPRHGRARYKTARQTLIALINRTPKPSRTSRDPKITFDRYFRPNSQKVPYTCDVFTLFSPKISVAEPKIRIKSSPDLSVEPSLSAGIDLALRGHEVRKLFFAGYGRRVLRYGYDPEDVLQEIYQGILVRNKGKCPFDPSKSSFGHYVHMICGCIVSNYRRRYSRLERNEQFGVTSVNGEVLDVGEADMAVSEPDQEMGLGQSMLKSTLEIEIRKAASHANMSPDLTEVCMAMMIQGHRKGEIVARTGEPPNTIAKMLKLIRTVAGEWR
jgi:hypothetical protein